MARYHTVKIDSIYLTQNGLLAGKPCKVDVTGLPKIVTTKTGQIINSANGTPIAQLINFQHKGIIIECKFEWTSVSVYNSIIAIHEAAKNTGGSIAIEIAGLMGTFSKNVIPKVPDDIDFSGFSSDTVKDFTVRYSIT